MTLENLLDRLELPSNKVVFAMDENNNAPEFSNEILQKLKVIKPDAYYSFNNQPYILFFDLTKEKNELREEIIHKQIWSFDYSPLAFVVKGTNIEVYNAFSFDKKIKRLEQINISNDEIEEHFSFWKLQSGSTWKWLQETIYSKDLNKKRVNQKLFDNIKTVRQKLVYDGINEENANILILRLIFIRYLIDRNVKIDKKYISGSSIINKRKSFGKLIEDSDRLNEFFTYLNDRFNGVLFKDTFTTLSSFQSKYLSFIFDWRKDPETLTLFGNNTDFFFEFYDFSIIPVEVISGIYESLINIDNKDETSAIYTPSFLVEYILNSTVDKFLLKNNGSECKVFDPAMGSGIFLVQSLRKMIDKELELNGNKLTNKQFKIRIGDIAKNNLFGIDVNEQALKVACFSVYVALLDYQQPKDIDKYDFPNLLNENFFKANFFDEDSVFNSKVKKLKVDFILGNPPWKSNKDSIHIKWLKKNKKVTGRFEIAQSYLLRSKDFMVNKTISSLIVTSTIFYNISKTTKTFKKEFLTTYCLDTFLDMSPVRRIVFEGEKVKINAKGKSERKKYSNPAVVVIYKLGKPEECIKNVVDHYSIKSNMFLKYYKSLVIEKNDRNNILQKHFIENDWMFKVALYGSTFDFNFIRNLTNHKYNILNLIDENTVHKGAGISRGKDPDPFPELEGLPILENSSIMDFYTQIDKKNVLKSEDIFLDRGRNIEIFEGAKIIFKEQNRDESYPVLSYVDGTCVFRKGCFSITSLNDNIIKGLYAYFISDLYTYYLFAISCAWGISTRPAIRLDEEFLSFPFKNTSKKQQEKLIKLVTNFLQPFVDYYQQDFRSESLPINENILAQINKEINRLYMISEIEKDFINYALDISRYQFQESKQEKVINFRDKEKDLLKYAEVIKKEFGNLYDDEHLWIEIYFLNHFIAINCKYLKKGPTSKQEIIIKSESSEKNILNALSDRLTIWSITDSKNTKNNLYIQKDIKGFEENSFYIIKPNEYKCWHRAMAWQDAAEIRDKIEQAELNYLNKAVNKNAK